MSLTRRTLGVAAELARRAPVFRRGNGRMNLLEGPQNHLVRTNPALIIPRIRFLHRVCPARIDQQRRDVFGALLGRWE